MLYTQARDGLFFRISTWPPTIRTKIWPRKERKLPVIILSEMCCRNATRSWITVNCCGDAAIQPRCAEEAGLRALLLHPHDRAAARTRSTLWVSISAVPLCCGRPRSSAHPENHEVS